jgi:xanthine dehydrogenase accessory factor
VALTPGGGRVGSLLAGALDGQLADLAGHVTKGRLVDLRVSDVDALVAGLPGGGSARCVLVPAGELPAGLWALLLERQPVCIASRLDGVDVVGTAVFTADSIGEAGEPAGAMFGRGVSAAAVTDEAVVTVLWPVPKLVVVGGGPVASALEAAAALLGWQTQIVNDVAVATGLIAALAPLDKVVVAAHDFELAGAALAAALETDVGYIGALGGRRMQQTRADWLAYRGVTELDRIHGPAGLDIGAETPAQIAVAILAEALAVEAGKASLRTLDLDDSSVG